MVMESPTDEKIIQDPLNTSINDDRDSYDNCVLSTISSKVVFPAVITLNNYFVLNKLSLV